jgi:hypothetical protein
LWKVSPDFFEKWLPKNGRVCLFLAKFRLFLNSEMTYQVCKTGLIGFQTQGTTNERTMVCPSLCLWLRFCKVHCCLHTKSTGNKCHKISNLWTAHNTRKKRKHYANATTHNENYKKEYIDNRVHFKQVSLLSPNLVLWVEL